MASASAREAAAAEADTSEKQVLETLPVGQVRMRRRGSGWRLGCAGGRVLRGVCEGNLMGGGLVAFLSIVICDLRCLIGLCDDIFCSCLDSKLRYCIAVAVDLTLTCENADS